MSVIPETVAEWEPAEQLRWFEVHTAEIGAQLSSVWDRYYCVTVKHCGLCCESCQDDADMGYSELDECCCKAYL